MKTSIHTRTFPRTLAAVTALVVGSTMANPMAQAQSGTPELVIIQPGGGSLSDPNALAGNTAAAQSADPVTEAAAKCLANPRDKLSCTIATGSQGGLETFQGQLETVIIRRQPAVSGTEPSGLAVAPLDPGNASVSAAPVQASVVATKSDDGLVMHEVNIQFDYNSATLRPSEIGKVVQIAAAMRHNINAGTRFVFIGHTDARGSENYNCSLSRRRAEAVVAAVSGAGVQPERLIAVGVGEHVLRRPDAPEDAINRRVGLGKLDESGTKLVREMERLCSS